MQPPHIRKRTGIEHVSKNAGSCMMLRLLMLLAIAVLCLDVTGLLGESGVAATAWASPRAPPRRGAECGSSPESRAMMKSRRSVPMLGLLLAGQSAPSTADAFEYPPAPDDNPSIRKLQEKAWAQEGRTKKLLYLQEFFSFGLPPWLSGEYPVHRGPDSNDFDILEVGVFAKAQEKGRIKVDKELTAEKLGVLMWVYTNPETDRQFVIDKLGGVKESFAYSPELLAELEELRARPFGTLPDSE